MNLFLNAAIAFLIWSLFLIFFADSLFWGTRVDQDGKKQLKYWETYRKRPTHLERAHFLSVSLSHDKEKIAREYLTFIDLPKRGHG